LAPRRTGREACPRITARGRLRRLVSRMSEPSPPLTARGRFGDTRSRLAAGSGWRKPQNTPFTARGRSGEWAQSLLAAGLNPKHCGAPGHTAGRRAHRADDPTSDIKTTTQKTLPPQTPTGGPPVYLRREVLYPPVGDYVLWVLGLPGKPWLEKSWRLLLPGA